MNGLTTLVFITGGGMLVWASSLRYLSNTNLSEKRFKRMVLAFTIVDIRIKSRDAVSLLLQFTGLLSIVLGVGYSQVLNHISISKSLDDLITFFVIFSPAFLLIVAIRYLNAKYW